MSIGRYLIVVALTLMAGAAHAQTLVGITLGEPVAAARYRIDQTIGRHEVAPPSSQVFETTYIFDRQNRLIGSMASCRGTVWSVSITVASCDDFYTLLRSHIAEWGSPIVHFLTIPFDDGSSVAEQLKYDWPQRHYGLSDPVPPSRVSGVQTISLDARCR